MPTTTRIVILGGGFGGVYTARRLERLIANHRDIHVTLVSRENYLLMTPLLFEASSGILEPRHAVHPIRTLLRKTRFIEAEVERIDLDKRIVFARPGGPEIYEIPYDQLVIALGGVTDRSRVPGSEHAATFKTLADAIFLRNEVIELFERADVELDPQLKRRFLTFVVVGAGLVGVELLGELTAFAEDLCRTYANISPAELRFELIEAGPAILKEMDPDLAEYAAKALRQRGVSIRTSTHVARVEPHCVHLNDGQTIEAHTILLAAGVSPSPLAAALPLEKDRKGRIAVDATMRSKSDPRIWALGDCASIPDPNGQPYPPLAQHALRQAKVLAGNLIAALHHQPLKPFVYETLGMLAALGHYRGVGRIMRFKFRGFIAWWIWRTYYLLQMPHWERRLRIMLDWTVALFFRHDTVKLDLFGEEHPLDQLEQPRPAQRPSAGPHPGEMSRIRPDAAIGRSAEAGPGLSLPPRAG